MTDKTPPTAAGERLTALCEKLLDVIKQYPEALTVLVGAIEELLHEAEATNACSPIVIKRIRQKVEAMKQRLRLPPVPPVRPTPKP